MRRTDFTKALTYTGQKLKGVSTIELKIDGVRLLSRDGKIVTRNDKVPPGLDRALTQAAKDKIEAFGDCELFKLGKPFHFMNGNLSKHDPDIGIFDAEDVWSLAGVRADDRLHLEFVDNLTQERADYLMKRSVADKFEGIIIRNGKRWYRHKPEYTADVRVTGYFEQLDVNKRPKGILGGFTTNYGRVTAFTEADRVALWVNPGQHVGKLMQVRYRELYHTGKFRYAVQFMHFRTDKDEEAFDTKAL